MAHLAHHRFPAEPPQSLTSHFLHRFDRLFVALVSPHCNRPRVFRRLWSSFLLHDLDYRSHLSSLAFPDADYSRMRARFSISISEMPSPLSLAELSPAFARRD